MLELDARPSATGLNNNVEFMGKQLHVQTENIGMPTPSIVTQVFSNGRVIYSKKTECSSPMDDIQDQMRRQHVQVIQTIAEKQARLRSVTERAP